MRSRFAARSPPTSDWVAGGQGARWPSQRAAPAQAMDAWGCLTRTAEPAWRRDRWRRDGYWLRGWRAATTPTSTPMTNAKPTSAPSTSEATIARTAGRRGRGRLGPGDRCAGRRGDARSPVHHARVVLGRGVLPGVAGRDPAGVPGTARRRVRVVRRRLWQLRFDNLTSAVKQILK